MTLQEALTEGISDFNSWANRKPLSYFVTTNEAELRGIFYNKLKRHLSSVSTKLPFNTSNLTAERIANLVVTDRRITKLVFASSRYSGSETEMLVSALNTEASRIDFNEVTSKEGNLFDIVDDINNFKIN